MSNVHSSATDTSISVAWDTNKSADTYASLSGPSMSHEWVSHEVAGFTFAGVSYNLKTGLLEHSEEELETWHFAYFSDLIPDTKYTVIISSTDSTGVSQKQVTEISTIDSIAINETVDNQRSGSSKVQEGIQEFEGGDGHPIILLNNPQAVNPTWSQLLAFLESDTTDKLTYSPTFVCADFAEILHNNAEKAGLRAAFVVVDIIGPAGIPSILGAGHTLNAFRTTVHGLVFIDCVGAKAGELGPANRDKLVELEVWREYVARPLFPELGWQESYESIGMVRNITVFQW